MRNSLSNIPPQDPAATTFRHSLTGKLMLWFLALSLVPLTLISFISYRSARNSIKQTIADSLSAITENQAAHIKTYFQRMTTDLKQQASSQKNTEFLLTLSMNKEESGGSIREFIESRRWEMLVAEREGDLKNLCKLFGYRDIFLIDTQGNILFSVMREDNLGANLFTNKNLSGTLFAKAARKTLETGESTFSDFERQSASVVSGYLTASIIDNDNKQIGLFAIQIGIEDISRIMASGGKLGRTSESYLIGTDLSMRSSSRLSEYNMVFGDRIDTEQTRLWKNDEKKELSSYEGYRGIAVLGSHRTVDIEGVRFCLISEVEQSEAYAPAHHLALTSIWLAGVTIVLVGILSGIEARRITRPLRQLANWAERIGEGDLRDVKISTPPNETGILYQTFRTTVASLRKSAEEHQALDWINEGVAQLNDAMRGQKEISALCHDIIAGMCRHLNIPIGALFLSTPENHLLFTSGYAFHPTDEKPLRFQFGEGLVGQTAQNKALLLVEDVTEEHLSLSAAVGSISPRYIVCVPLIYNRSIGGVIELGSLNPFSKTQIAFLNQVGESIAIAINAAKMQKRTQTLLEESQAQAEELQNQEERLRAANEELEEKSEELQVQQEELRQTNEELQEKTDSLVLNSKEIKEKNLQLEEAGRALQQKAEDLALASKYKSEFLANMSHELRTPLNSLLVLAHHLAENKAGNLSDDQVESAEVIAASGESLLVLINDILDLSKIEAGKMILQPRDVGLRDISAEVRTHFIHMAENKGLELNIELDPALPKTIYTDPERLQQIIRNLVSNAIKFTPAGHVTIRFAQATPNNSEPAAGIEISVSDSGIGIPPDKLQAVFEAFQQADGSTSRRYGGTGLGLSITRELTLLLGGEVSVESEEGKGSVFTIRLPEKLDYTPESPLPKERPAAAQHPVAEPIVLHPAIPDDRNILSDGDKVVLLIEDDPNFAKTLSLIAHEKQFKCLHAPDGPTGLKMAEQHCPDAIILDIRMPGMDGWQVLDTLKTGIHTRHIPVHIMSVEEEQQDAVQKGAVGYLTKPVSREDLDRAFARLGLAASKDVKDLLVVEDDKTMRLAITKLLSSENVKTTPAETIREALEILHQGSVDCMILDLSLPDGSGADLLKQITEDETLTMPPVIIYTGKELTREQDEGLREYTQSIIVKGPMAEERLVDETALFLHQVVEKMPERKREMVLRLYEGDAALKNRTVLLVDDDMRNAFALSKVMEERGLRVHKASDGEKALKRLREEPDIELVLMDIMMPNMDGYEAMRRIRDPQTDIPDHDIPIIALTAKAMKEDRAKCIEAGANDYLSKPVKMDKLLSLMRVWLAT